MPKTRIENLHEKIKSLIIDLKESIELFRPIFKNNLSEAQEEKRIELAGCIHGLFLSSQSAEQLKLLKLETKKQPFLLDFIFRTTKTKFQKELYFLLKDELKYCKIEMEQFLYNENDSPAYGPIDIVITLPDGEKIAIECDGESHDTKDSTARDIAIAKLTQTTKEQVNYYVITHETSDNPQKLIKETLAKLKEREKAIIEKNRQQRAEIEQKKPAPIEIKKGVEAQKPAVKNVEEETSNQQRQKKSQQGKKGEKRKKGTPPKQDEDFYAVLEEFLQSETKSEFSELSQIISEAIQKSLKLNPELLEQHKAEIILKAIFNAKTNLQTSKTQPKKDILFGNVDQLIFDLYCSVDTSKIKTITEYLIKEYPLHQISNILEFLMQEYEEVKTSQKNKAYEEKLQEILVMFLQEKKLINTHFFTSATHICSQKGWLEILKKVIDKNEIDMLDEANGSSALHYACSENNADIVEQLLQKNASIYIKDKDGFFPLTYAVIKKNQDIFTKIIEKLPPQNNKKTIAILQQAFFYASQENDIFYAKQILDFCDKRSIDKETIINYLHLYTEGIFAGKRDFAILRAIITENQPILDLILQNYHPKSEELNQVIANIADTLGKDKNYQVPEIIIDTIKKLLTKQSQDKIIFPLQEVGIDTGLSRYIANGETNSSSLLFDTLLKHSSIEIKQLLAYLTNASATKEEMKLKMETSEIELIQKKMKTLLEYIFQQPSCIVGTIDEESIKFLLHVIENKDRFNIKEGAKNNLLESITKYKQKLSPNTQTKQSQVLQLQDKKSKQK